MFNPNAPQDFAAQTADLERQRAMAEMLRKRASSTQAPQAQMVGGQYVNPHWAQFLPGLLDKVQAGYAESKAADAEKGMGQQVAQARDQWTSSLPRATAAVPGRVALPGPPEGGGSPELEARAAVPASSPSRDSVLRATMAGLQIPGNKEAAMLWNKGMGDDLAREDVQADRRETQTTNLLQQKELALEKIIQQEKDAARRSEDTRLGIEQRREAAELMAELRRQGLQTQREIAAMRVDKPKELKPLPAAQAKAWTENNKAMKFIDDALVEVEAYPQGLGLANALGNTIRSRMDPKGVNVRATVGNIGSLKVHDRSGAAVTAAEQPRLVPFIPQPTDNAATTEKKLKLFKREYELMQQEIADLAETQGYKSPVKGDRDVPAEETKTIGGVTYVKRNGEWHTK